ncbi:glycosyltransferase family 4 protein [Anaerosphaera multitolerans]|uniref:Glycosyltransferase n=1 Tax=Anaerosphaera multitolerans TaxID=2487351 RepID=A0A437S6F0_9FIRM|nr:glycosyltransferase family 4 protein [Anaerosphaera multitolerans]RVU54578.1 glycosyltransferase [Anaerosphaera multitolerans]
MKVLIFKDNYSKIEKSGVGHAIRHQERALSKAGVETTSDLHSNFDLVHINTVFPKSYILAKKSIKKGIPLVYHAHSTEEDFRNSFLFSNLLAPLFRKWIIKCYTTSNLILTPTEYSKKILKGYGIKERIEVLSNGIDLDFWKSKPNDREVFEKKYKSKGKKIVISVGLYIKRKGILDFVELAKRLPQYEFYWFGYMDLNLVPKEIRDAVNSDLDNLHFPGYVSSNELRMAYSACDLYFFPTYEETEGIVLLEALACRAKTLIRDIPIYEDDFEDGVNIYKGNDVNEFEGKIVDIIEGNLKDLTEESYKIVEERSIENVGLRLKKLYGEILNVGNRFSES